ncbi:MAG: hypothetical protein M1817_003726 [Caeruleum heppii]|nr:MAG: hypothetical protein M1817_003726 [Caeruleum heppii]
MDPVDHCDQYTVGWICALDIELAAAQAMLDETHDSLLQSSDDHNNYTLGRMASHNVVIGVLPSGEPGTTAAAYVAAHMLRTFRRIRIGFMVGVGGGAPSPRRDIRLGDVVVSQPTGTSAGVIQYDFGKRLSEDRFMLTGQLNRPPDVLLTALTKLKAEHLREGSGLQRLLDEMVRRNPGMEAQYKRPPMEDDTLFMTDYDHPDETATCDSVCDPGRLVPRPPREFDRPMIYYGTIASGNQVMKHGPTRDRLQREHDILCFEMEAAGLMSCFPCIVIRGICDYADSHKNKQWQPHAAAVAAAYAKNLLQIIRSNDVDAARLAAEATRESSRPGSCQIMYGPGLSFEEFRLASLIPNIKEPDVDAFRDVLVRTDDMIVKERSSSQIARSPLRRAAVEKVSSLFQRRAQSPPRQFRTRTLLQPTAIFNELCQTQKAKQWIQGQFEEDNHKNIHFLVGYDTLLHDDATDGSQSLGSLSESAAGGHPKRSSSGGPERGRQVGPQRPHAKEEMFALRLRKAKFNIYHDKATAMRLAKNSYWMQMPDNRAGDDDDDDAEWVEASLEGGDEQDGEGSTGEDEENDIELYFVD